jgi:antitoxin MazE
LVLEVLVQARKIVKWGNSLAVRIPTVVLRDAGLQEGDTLLFGTRNGALVAKPLKKKPTLEELVAKITPENVHEEVNWGPARGKEFW